MTDKAREEFDSIRLQPWIRNNPVAGRAFIIGTLPLWPIIVAISVLWEHRSEFADLKQLFKAAFRPWKVKP